MATDSLISVERMPNHYLPVVGFEGDLKGWCNFFEIRIGWIMTWQALYLATGGDVTLDEVGFALDRQAKAGWSFEEAVSETVQERRSMPLPHGACLGGALGGSRVAPHVRI